MLSESALEEINAEQNTFAGLTVWAERADSRVQLAAAATSARSCSETTNAKSTYYLVVNDDLFTIDKP
jgi:hypothetical protein